MSRYVKSITVNLEYGGDHIKAVLKPLRFDDLMALHAASKDGESGMLSAFFPMLPRYVVTIEGAVDSDGNAVEVGDLADAYWGGLVAQLMSRIIEATQPTPT